jgi:Protein of unknown function (DUF3017)
VTVPPAGHRHRFDALAIALAGVAAGVVIATVSDPQLGMFVVAGAMTSAALLRLVLRSRAAGSLVVRSRRVDVVVLAGFAVAIAVLAAVTPFPKRG